MKDIYTASTEELLKANQQLKMKIQYLERNACSRQYYIEDLKEELKVNKFSLRRLIQGSQKEGEKGKEEVGEVKDKKRSKDEREKGKEEVGEVKDKKRSKDEREKGKENQKESLMGKLYAENNMLSASLLMEKQMRHQDSLYYDERLREFQNCIVDLRKFLHDKEDSFTSVIARLKKYEDIGEMCVKEKLAPFRDEFSEDVIKQILTKLTQERNYFRQLYQKNCNPCNIQYQQNKNLHASDILQNKLTADKNQMKTKVLYSNKSLKDPCSLQSPTLCPGCTKRQTDQLSKISPNKELIRLLKKEKLSNEILEQALNDSIQKNEELFNINEQLQSALATLELKYSQCRTENILLKTNKQRHERQNKREVFVSGKFQGSGQQNEHQQLDKRLETIVLRGLKREVNAIKFGMKMKFQQGSKSVCESIIQWKDEVEYMDVIEY